MAYRATHFLLTPESALYEIPDAVFAQLLKSDSTLKLPRYAGKRIRCAEVIVELINGVPIRSVNLRCFTIFFDSQGRTDGTVLTLAAMRSFHKLLEAAQARTSEGNPSSAPNIIEAAEHFERRQPSWTPSLSQQQSMVAAALGRSKISKFKVSYGKSRGDLGFLEPVPS